MSDLTVRQAAEVLLPQLIEMESAAYQAFVEASRNSSREAYAEAMWAHKDIATTVKVVRRLASDVWRAGEVSF